MAIVFLATDVKHQRPVAIKVLRPELAAAVGHERFLREIEIAAKLQHPHILPVYDSGQADGMLYYVMPFVEGESLRDRLSRGGAVPHAEAARIAREVADALAYAHRQGIVHRDIKPANILLSQGHAVVADFGVARAVSASAARSELTQTGMAVGTPTYMSPEQALGETNLDGRTDVYALGVVLYEMLAGSPPFEGATPQSIVAQALSRKAPPLAHDALGLEPVIERALAREPGDRFTTADELGGALDALLSGTGFRQAARRRTRSMAREARVGTLLLGAVRREGDSLAIEAKVHDVRSGDRLATYIVRAAWSADPRPLFDTLAARILGTSGAPPGERPSVLAQTTSSIAAYRAYLEGSAALQRLQLDSAQLLLERAVALDSGFALAYLKLYDAGGWGLGIREHSASGWGSATIDRRQFLLGAERHSASLPPRLRALVAFHRAFEDGHLAQARRIVQDLIARDPTDVEAWYQLGEAHYHDRSDAFPHPDSLGNLGRALRAFQHTLALDSSYVLAYQHILDALARCAGGDGSAAFHLCVRDSAVYGAPAALRRRFGARTVARWRDEARATQIQSARAWVAAVPGSWRPRQMLLDVLYSQRRYDEVVREARAMERLGWQAEAAFFKGMALFGLGRASQAATAVHDGLKVARDTLTQIREGRFGDWTLPAVLLAGAGGRWADGRRYNVTLGELGHDDSTNVGSLRMAAMDIAWLGDGYLGAEVGQLTARRGARSLADELRTTVDRYAGTDNVRRRRVCQGLGTLALAMFLSTRDTLLPWPLLRSVDTLAWATWHVADAHLALARGDTARARMPVERHYRAAGDAEFHGFAGGIRSFAWGDLLARLREPRLAIEAYAHLDSLDDHINNAGFVVRSWAERAAVYQQVGDAPQAIRYYERFIEAWQYADPELQPFVERARKAVAALKA